jgi:1,4-dihydroxy-2-naphthoate octaprenyltransferase
VTVPDNSRALQLVESPVAPTTPRVARRQASAYFRLGKFQIYEHWLPVLVAWSALENRLLGDLPVLATLLLVGLTAACIAGAGSALDDVQGIRDGIDLLTYHPSETERNIQTKPLLLGEMQESNAMRFAIAIAVLGFTGILAATVIAPHLPTWLLVVFVIVAFAATQYSYGLKLSYHGLGEILLAVANAATLLIAYGFASGHLPGRVLVEAGLLLCWMAQITIFSSVADVEHDRAGGRNTAVALASDVSHRYLVGAIFLCGWTLSVITLIAGILPAILALLLLPAWVLQARQLRSAFAQGSWLRARRLGWRAYDAGVAALIAANLLAHAAH